MFCDNPKCRKELKNNEGYKITFTNQENNIDEEISYVCDIICRNEYLRQIID